MIVSSPDASALLVVADAANAYPTLVRHVTSSTAKKETTHLKNQKYKFKNRGVVYSPILSAAIIVTRFGRVKLINCGKEQRWTAMELGRLKKNDAWALGFSNDGYHALALDCKGTLLVTEFC